MDAALPCAKSSQLASLIAVYQYPFGSLELRRGFRILPQMAPEYL